MLRKWRVASGEWRVEGSRQEAVGRRQSAEGRKEMRRGLPLRAAIDFFCLLPSSFCLLPTAFCLLAFSSAPLRADEPLAAAQKLAGPPKLQWPAWEKVVEVVTLQDSSTRLVVAGVMVLGVCAGVVGAFMLLRKRSLIGDVVGHCSLPGIATAFLIMEAAGPGRGKHLPGLLLGAVAAGLLGVLCTYAIRRFSKIKDDAAMAIVLGIFFGGGIALLTVIQQIAGSGASGLDSFIFGMTSLITAADVWTIAVASAAVLLLALLLFKEFALLCFDEGYAAAQGWPVTWLDLLLMGLVVGVTVIGLQAVGLLLMVAMLIIPPAAARFWSDRLGPMTAISAALGGASAYLGVLPSALVRSWPGGPSIVLVAAGFFVFSMFLGTKRGVLRRWLNHRRSQRRIGRHDLLRAAYELLETNSRSTGSLSARERNLGDMGSLSAGESAMGGTGSLSAGERNLGGTGSSFAGERNSGGTGSLSARALGTGGQAASGTRTSGTQPNGTQAATLRFDALLAHRSWSAARLTHVLSAARREGLIAEQGRGSYRLTERGEQEARQAVRNHRLWELYLIRYADIAPSHVDRDADLIEHVLGPELVDELESLLAQRAAAETVPESPH